MYDTIAIPNEVIAYTLAYDVYKSKLLLVSYV